MEIETIREILAHAPKEPGDIAEGLVGWETRAGQCLCSVCVGRAIKRGFLGTQLGCSIPVWNRPLKCDCCGASYDAHGVKEKERPSR